MPKKTHQKSVQELETREVDLHVDISQVDKEPQKERPYGCEYT